MSTNLIAFTKLQGLGNDFVLIDNRGQDQAVTEELARVLADRRLGIGCDQVLVLEAPVSPDTLCAYRIFNADGSPAEQCGNGARAIALWLNLRGELNGPGRLDSPAGPIAVRPLGQGQIEAELSVPAFVPDQINTDWHGPAPWPLDVGGGEIACYGASLGNPHVLVLAEDSPAPLSRLRERGRGRGQDTPPSPQPSPRRGEGADHEDFLVTLGESINAHPRFPAGANVGLARIADTHTLHLRVFERGAGLTPACGSGAAAAAAMLIRAGKMQSPVTVIQPGGTLVIQWSGEGQTIKMTGPAAHVFNGEIEWSTKN